MISTIILACLLPISTIWAFFYGVKAGRSIKEEKELPKPFEIKKAPPRIDKKEEKRLSQLMRNVEMYDGSNKNQRKIDV